MKLNAIIRGNSLAELLANANEVCTRFYGPGVQYRISMEQWDMAQGEYAADGTVSNFQFSMMAEKL